MLLTPQHRRSNRVRDNAVKKYIENNKIEKIPGLLYRKNKTLNKPSSDEDDIYSDCPNIKGYEYDKDMYLANDRYATMVDNDIQSLKKSEHTNDE